MMYSSLFLFFSIINYMCTAQQDGLVLSNNNSNNPQLHAEHMFRIVGGSNAKSDEFPFMVSWFFKYSPLPACGGSLVASNLVLTAAHCENVDGLVHIGCNQASGCGNNIVANVIRKIKHPQYVNVFYDYMLLELDKDIRNIEPLQLNFDDHVPAEGNMLTVIGFGSTSEDGNFSPTLKKVSVPANSYDTCRSQYGPYIFDPIHMCAGFLNGGKDACQGDSGAPLMIRQNGGKFTQVGIVSHGAGCARKNQSGVYARISGVTDWLQGVICMRATVKPSYCNGNSVAATIMASKVGTPPPSPAPTRRRTPAPTPRRTPTPTPRSTPGPTHLSTPGPTHLSTPAPTIRRTPLPTRAPFFPFIPIPTASSSTPVPTTTVTAKTTATSQPPIPVPITPVATCHVCTNNPVGWMQKQDIQCDSSISILKNNCNNNVYWTNNKCCQLSCYNEGIGYNGDECCLSNDESPSNNPTTAPQMPTQLPNTFTTLDTFPASCTICTDNPIDWLDVCEGYIFLETKCNRNENWVANKYCQQSCYNIGLGYLGDECCVSGTIITPSEAPTTPFPSLSLLPTTTSPTLVPSTSFVPSISSSPSLVPSVSSLPSTSPSVSLVPSLSVLPTISPSLIPTIITPSPTAPDCISCTDTGNPWMESVGIPCALSDLIPRKCNKNGLWKKMMYCQYSCYKAELFYSDDVCCDP